MPTVNRLIRAAGVMAGIGVVAWLMRDRLLRVPASAEGPIPKFRVPAGNGERPPPPAQVGDDLTQITGIGPAYSRRLASSGMTTLAALASADPADLAGRIRVSQKQTANWIDQARRLT